MLTVFITSNQISLHVHAVFCQLHVHCIHLAQGMMRMRIPSIYLCSLVPRSSSGKNYVTECTSLTNLTVGGKLRNFTSGRYEVDVQ